MKNKQTNLTTKKCVPCEGGTPSLTEERIKELLEQVNNWKHNPGRKNLSRELEFKNFKEAMGFVNEVADVAEAEGHHPDIYLHDWNKVKIELTTHAISGLSENDFILAAKIDAVYGK